MNGVRHKKSEIQGYFCPRYRLDLMDLESGAFRLIDGDLERRCSHCHEWLPADTEFFYTNHRGLLSWCKACFNEARQERRAA